MADTWTVRTSPIAVEGPADQYTIRNLGPDTLYYGDRNVSATVNTGALTTGQQVTVASTVWIVSDGRSQVFIEAVASAGGVPAGGTSGQVLAKNSAADGDATWQTTPSVVPVFNVKDPAYGGKVNGSFDDSAALQAAHAAAAAAGGIVYVPAGTCRLATPVTASNYALAAAESLAGYVTLRGAGRSATTFQLVSPVATLLGNAPLSSSTAVLQRYSLEDFTVNAGQSSTGIQGIVIHWTSAAADTYPMQVDALDVRRVNTVNGGNSTGQTRHFIAIKCNRNTATPTTVAYFTNILIDDCYSGKIGGGGSYGIELSGFINPSSGLKTANGNFGPALTQNVTNPASTVIDGLTIRRFRHDTGTTPVVPIGTGSGSSVAIQLGGDGIVRNFHIEDCEGRNCNDVALELDSAANGTVINFRAIDCHNTGILVIPYGVGSGMEASHVRLYGCRVSWGATGTDGSNITTWQPTVGIIAQSRFGDTGGHVTVDACDVVMEGGWTASYAHFTANGVRSIVWDRCTSVTRNWTVNPGGARTLSHFKVQGLGHRANAVVRSCHTDTGGTITGAGSQMVSKPLVVTSATDLKLTVDGLTSRLVTAATGGASAVQEQNVDLSMGGNTIAEAFASDLLGFDCGFDSGAATNYTYAAGAYTASANLTTENRGVFYANLSTGGDSLVGSVLDGGFYWKATPGPTLTGYKAGAFHKRQDANNYLESYVYDDGTQTFLCLDAVRAGTRTSLLGTVGTNATGFNGIAGGSLNIAAIATPPAGVSDRGVLVTRIANGTALWPRITAVGNTIYGEYFTAVPGGNATVRPAGTGAYVTATLTGADINSFGDKAPLGNVGFTNIPQDAAKLDDLTWQRLHVISGASIERVRPLSTVNTPQFRWGVQYSPSVNGLARFTGLVRIRDCDFATLGPASTVGDFNITDAASAFRVEDHGWWSKPTGGAVTLTSGSWTNPNPWSVRVGVFGTPTSVTITPVGATATQVSDGRWAGVLAPGETVTVVGAATVNQVPVL